MREAPCVSKGSEEFVLPTVPGCVPAKTAAAPGVSATARGELAQPGGDGLLVAQRLAAPGGAPGFRGVGCASYARAIVRKAIKSPGVCLHPTGRLGQVAYAYPAKQATGTITYSRKNRSQT